MHGRHVKAFLKEDTEHYHYDSSHLLENLKNLQFKIKQAENKLLESVNEEDTKAKLEQAK